MRVREGIGESELKEATDERAVSEQQSYNVCVRDGVMKTTKRERGGGGRVEREGRRARSVSERADRGATQQIRVRECVCVRERERVLLSASD